MSMNKDFWDKVNNLETLAKQATPGPWDHRGGYNIFDDKTSREICVTSDRDNCDYIAAANPAFILEMLEKCKGRISYLEHRLVEQDIAMNNPGQRRIVPVLQALADRFDKGIMKPLNAHELQLFCMVFSAYLHGAIAGMEG